MGLWDTFLIPMITIIIGIIGFVIFIIMLMGYKNNSPSILKVLKIEYFLPKFILADGSISEPVIKSAEISKQNGIFHYRKRSYLAPNKSQFHQDNRPCYVYHYDNPYPLLLSDNQLVLKKIKEPPYDSKELYIAIQTKIWETWLNIPTDMWKMLGVIIGIISVMAIIYTAIQVHDVITGLDYMNDLIESIAKDQGIQLPPVKTSIFGE